jgi:hypothetical protein
MSFGNCVCPLPAEIVDIPSTPCGESIGQIQKFILARRSGNAFATLLLPAVLANWTTLLTANDATKHQVTPFVENVVIPASEPILEGGDDNTTVDGNPIVVGAGQIRATGMFAELTPAILVALKAFNCEKDLMIYFINNAGKIWGQNPSGTIFTGIPITSFFVSDAGNEGLNTRDKAPVGFNLRYGWRDKLQAIVPTDFDARLDL